MLFVLIMQIGTQLGHEKVVKMDPFFGCLGYTEYQKRGFCGSPELTSVHWVRFHTREVPKYSRACYCNRKMQEEPACRRSSTLTIKFFEEAKMHLEILVRKPSRTYQATIRISVDSNNAFLSLTYSDHRPQSPTQTESYLNCHIRWKSSSDRLTSG